MKADLFLSYPPSATALSSSEEGHFTPPALTSGRLVQIQPPMDGTTAHSLDLSSYSSNATNTSFARIQHVDRATPLDLPRLELASPPILLSGEPPLALSTPDPTEEIRELRRDLSALREEVAILRAARTAPPPPPLPPPAPARPPVNCTARAIKTAEIGTAIVGGGIITANVFAPSPYNAVMIAIGISLGIILSLVLAIRSCHRREM